MKKKIQQEKCEILSNHEVADNLFEINLASNLIAGLSQAGQFVEVKASQGYDPLWRRPFSIHDATNNKLTLLYQLRGNGTKFMVGLKKGDFLDIIGPLGNGFKFPDKLSKVILLGGGCGIAPLYLTAKTALEKNIPTEVIWGLSTCSENDVINKFIDLGLKIHIATEDGVYGKKGFVSEYYTDIIEIANSNIAVMACGPTPMLRSIHNYLKDSNASCQVSLENLMACGLGLCQGCTIKINFNDSTKMVRVCKEGPVFEAKDIHWE